MLLMEVLLLSQLLNTHPHVKRLSLDFETNVMMWTQTEYRHDETALGSDVPRKFILDSNSATMTYWGQERWFSPKEAAAARTLNARFKVLLDEALATCSAGIITRVIEIFPADGVADLHVALPSGAYDHVTFNNKGIIHCLEGGDKFIGSETTTKAERFHSRIDKLCCGFLLLVGSRQGCHQAACGAFSMESPCAA